MSHIITSYMLKTREITTRRARELTKRARPALSPLVGNDEDGGPTRQRPILKAVGILGLNIVLGCFAGLILSSLELPVELKARTETAALVARLNTSMSPADWEALLSALGSDAAALQADVIAVESGTLHKLDANWDSSGSLFFAFTIATTLGYGTFAPVTPAGRLFTIMYALVSIPLMALAFIKCVLRARSFGGTPSPALAPLCFCAACT